MVLKIISLYVNALLCICLIFCTESETYVHVGLRDGGPFFLRLSVFMHFLYLCCSETNIPIWDGIFVI